MGTENFQTSNIGRPIELLSDHQKLEPMLKKNRSNKTYSGRITLWLDRLPHIDSKQLIVENHPGPTDFLRRNPLSESDPKTNYD